LAAKRMATGAVVGLDLNREMLAVARSVPTTRRADWIVRGQRP